MKKNKINKKACTNCGLEAAVARKVCSGCNTPFYTKRPTYFYESKDAESSDKSGSSGVGASTSGSNTNEDGSRRRTERVKREKPHFYDASEFQNKNKKKKNDKNKVSAAKQSKSLAAQLNKKEKKRLKEIKLRESLAEAEDERIYDSIMTPEKAHQLSVILEELNNKMIISAWKPS